MKTIQYLFLTVIVAMLFVACSEEDIEDVTATGRNALVNTWNCEEDASGLEYTLKIVTDNATDDGIKIFNFHGQGDAKFVTATYDESLRKITIPAQDIGDYTVSGNGTVASDYNTMSFNYSTDDGSEQKQITTSCRIYQISK